MLDRGGDGSGGGLGAVLATTPFNKAVASPTTVATRPAWPTSVAHGTQAYGPLEDVRLLLPYARARVSLKSATDPLRMAIATHSAARAKAASWCPPMASYSMCARLEQADGHHDNQVIFTTARPQVPDPGAFNAAYDLVDEWLARIEADHRDLPLAEKVRRNRPAAAVDTC